MMDYAARVEEADTYPKMLRLNSSEFGHEIALREKDLGLWRLFTWADYHARVHHFALGMVELGLGRGDVIGIIGDNRPDWVSAEIAAHAIGAMSLGLYRDVLDEPMAGMNFEEKEDMARYIVDLNEEFGMTVMMIEHDMGVVMDISHRVAVLDFGRKIAEGDPAAVLADPHVKRAYLGEEDEVLVDPDDKVQVAENAA